MSITIKRLSIDEMTSTRKPDVDQVSSYIDLYRAGAKWLPVVVNVERAIIDGLNRVEAARQLEQQTIEGIVALTYEEAIAGLKVNHADLGIIPPVRRAQDMYEILLKLAHQYTTVNRGLDVPTSRALLADAIGVKESTLSCITAFYSNLVGASDERRVRAQEIKDDFEAGNRSPSWALNYVSRGSVKLDGGIADVKQQRAVFTTVVGSIRGALRGLGGLRGVNSNITDEELEGWISELRASRRDLAKYIHLLEECRNHD